MYRGKMFGQFALGTALVIFFIFAGMYAAHPATAQVEVNSEVYLVNPIGGKIIKDNDPAKVKAAAQGISGGQKLPLLVLIGGIIKKALTIIGSLTMVSFVYGGFLWVTSAGKADKVEMGKKIMLWAVIGVFIIFSAYAILSTVISGLGVRGTL